MTSKIIAGTSAGSALVFQSDTSGALEIQTGAVPTTAMTVSAVQAVVYPGSVTFNGTATFAGTPSFPTAVPVTSGGTGLTATPTNGQLDIGNGTGFTRAALTAGTGVSVTNGAGSVTLANTGVTSIVAGTGISISGATGAVTVNSTVTAPVSSVNSATGAVVINRGMQFFTTTTNWTAPAGVIRVRIYAVGGSQGGSNLPAGGTAGIVSLGVYAPGGAQNQQPVGVGGSFNINTGVNQSLRLYNGNSNCGGAIYYGQGSSSGGLVVGSAAVVAGTVYSVTAGASFSGDAAGFCWLEW